MIDLLSKEDRKDIVALCTKWIKGDLTVQYIKDTVANFDWAVSTFIPEPEDSVHASNSLNILMLDILGMDSISDEEKDSSIMELYERREEELKDLARRAIEQVEINHQEFLEEAEQRGYCPILTKNQ
jgi:hypothetical protein